MTHARYRDLQAAVVEKAQRILRREPPNKDLSANAEEGRGLLDCWASGHYLEPCSHRF